MGLPRFFRVPQHKRFNYQPLYYDEEKERREERIREIEREMGIENKDGNRPYSPSIGRGSFATMNTRRRKVQRSSNIRLIILILFLFFITYFILFR
jgi:hypothetical protein